VKAKEQFKYGHCRKIKVNSLFSDYKIQSNADNEIGMEVPTEPLCQALRSAAAQSSAEVTLKLAKKHDRAVLTFEVKATSSQGKSVLVTHDVRIHVKKPSDVDKLVEPHCPDPDAHILLPSLAKLRTVTDHLRQMSTHVAISANRSGEFSLKIRTEDVMVETAWSGCETPNLLPDAATQEPNEDVDSPDMHEMHHIIISVKSLLHFLSTHVIKASTIACICANHCLILYVYIGELEDSGGVLTFYLPAKNE